MPPPATAVLKPRKSPVQARSAVTVEAILDATIQVLLRVGKERLTTTRVAARAGVSVGTLYQYFPNKSSLLAAALKRHMDEVCSGIERVCAEQRGQPLEHMTAALVSAFLAAKMRDVKTSVALYAVSSDVDGARIVQQLGLRMRQAIAAMLASSPGQLHSPPELVASVLQGVMSGVSHRILESPHPEKQLPALRDELLVLATAYVRAASPAR